MSDNYDLHDKRISRLYRMGSKTEPPKHIDEEITRTAHNAIPGRKRRFIRPSLATAAVLVLSISLVLKVLNQEPLEESVMDPTPTDQGSGMNSLPEPETDTLEADFAEEKAATPAAMMQDADTSRVIKPTQQPPRSTPKEYRATEPGRKAPPAFKQDDAVGAAQIAPAPTKKARAKLQKKSRMQQELGGRLLRQKQKAIAPATSGMLEGLDCKAIPLPDSNSVAEWYRLYKAAMEQGQEQNAKCLKQAFFTRFGKALPEHLDE